MGSMYVCKARALIEYLGKFLLIERTLNGHEMLVLPGGKVEMFDENQSDLIKEIQVDSKEQNYNDVMLNALRREIYEELKISLPSTIDYCCSNFYINKDNDPVIDVIFYAKLSEHPQISVDGEEVKSFVWLDLKSILSSDNVHDWLKKALKIFDKIDA